MKGKPETLSLRDLFIKSVMKFDLLVSVRERKMKRVLLLMCALCLLAVPAFAQEATPEMTGSYAINAPTDLDPAGSLAFVRFVHAAADVGPVDIYLAETPDTPVVANLTFGEVTEEVLLPSSAGLIAQAAGSEAGSETTTQLDFELGGNSSWIVAVVGLNSNASVLLEPISVLRSDYNEMARVRVMNLVASDATFSVTSDADMDFGTELGFNSMADNDIEPGSYTLSLTGADGSAVGESEAYTFDANTTNTLLIVGAADGSQPIRVIPVVSPRDVSHVQFVNTGTEPVDIFIRPGDTAVVNGLEGGATSEWVEVPSGAATFITYAPGTGPTGQEQAALPLQLDPSRDVVITFGADGLAELTSVELSQHDHMEMNASG
jgi:hypothetical protein